jgi:hypothetical protein
MGTFAKLAVLGCAGLVLASCQTISKEECAVTNWRDLGVRDGQQGFPATRIERHSSACAKAGITVDTTAYLGGRDIGIRSYCTPANGLQVGRSGSNYRNSCPAELEPAFLRSYLAASQLRRAENRLRDAQRRVQTLTDRAFSNELTPEQRRELQLDVREARTDVRQRELDVRDAQTQYNRVAGSLGL